MMIVQKCSSAKTLPLPRTKPANVSNKASENAKLQGHERVNNVAGPADIDIDLREVYFLIMHFLSASPCQKSLGLLWNELMEHKLLPRRYHAWYTRSGMHNDEMSADGSSLPLSYEDLVLRYPHIEKDHLVKLLKQLILSASFSPLDMGSRPNAADVPTLLGIGRFSLLTSDINEKKEVKHLAPYLRWPHMQADQVRALSLRAIGGGFTRHHRAPSIHAASHAIAKPSTMIQKMQNVKKLRGHRNAVYCAIFDRSGRYVITGSDDRLVKIWSMETAFCLASCRGHEGDITDLAVSSNNALVASASNDFVIRVWRLPDGVPISVLQGHTGAVTAIAFSPRTSSSAVYQLLSSSDDGTCRLWDARYSQSKPRIYVPRPADSATGKCNVPSTSSTPQNHQILCCAYNANGTVFVTGSSDTLARVWSAYKPGAEDSEQPIHEIDVLSGHENDVNYVQFSGCAVSPRSTTVDALKDEHNTKFKNLWFCHDNIVTCSRDGSAIIWIPRSRRSHGKVGRWMKAYHLKVPPPPLPPQPPRGGPRQRILPTPRGVNMIVWSLDNRFVLAAIMDCRICVWNAADGSLVHSLTGHTESTYVLDVHPFNPRIAMSAGYDGRTIIWDIWEGTPVRIFEIGRFKLVDGKFSMDGTSIVLSDEVGQIYLLSTGQGESHKDAKYDQFFLGDYRPLIRDSIGNVLDQETQLAPHRRNFQDLLSDSGMIPYPEPYQSMYQKHRLRILGMEWHPSTINFATGPDFSLGEDFQTMPIADLDAVFDVPEILDTNYWEPPENEARSDDADSEYNVSDEYASEREQESLSPSSYSDTDSDAENDGLGQRESDGLRRSKRKKEVAEVEFTSSGRRIKRRNVEGRGGKVSKIGHNNSKKRFSKPTSSRSRRSSARSAMCVFSRIPDTDSDEDVADESESSFSGSDSLQDFSIQSDDAYQENLTTLHPSGRKLDLGEELEPPSNPGSSRRLVLKFSVRDPKTTLSSGTSTRSCNEQNELGSRPSVFVEKNGGAILSAEDPGASSANASASKFNGSINRIKLKYKGPFKEYNNTLQTSVAVNETDSMSDGDTQANDRLSCPDKDLFRPSDEVLEHGNHENQICSNNLFRDVKENAQHMSTRLKIRCGRVTEMTTNGSEDLGGALELPASQPESSGGVLEDIISNTHNYNHHKADIEVSDSEDNVPYRSTELKTTSRDLSVGKAKLKLKKSGGFVGTSNWMSNSHITKPRSNRSRHNHSYHDQAGSSTVRQSISGLKSISWLMSFEHEPGYRYIPQLGDEVVYLRQGHEEYMKSSGSNERGPWAALRGKINAVEICQIDKLDYATVPSGESCCKITLKFVDPSSNVVGRTFKLTLPELVNFPDFLVEKSWYDAAMSKSWNPGDKCLVWWRNENGESGSWWEGRVISSRPKSHDFPDSPWERYTVEYTSDPVDTQLHSPWELHDPDARSEHPHVGFKIRDELHDCLGKLEKSVGRGQDPYGIEKLNKVSLQSDFLNRFPVPLSPEVIRLRVDNSYYRSLEAVKHDIEVMLSNARSYFGKKDQLAAKMKKLGEYFKKKLPSL